MRWSTLQTKKKNTDASKAKKNGQPKSAFFAFAELMICATFHLMCRQNRFHLGEGLATAHLKFIVLVESDGHAIKTIAPFYLHSYLGSPNNELSSFKDVCSFIHAYMRARPRVGVRIIVSAGAARAFA